MKLNNGIDNSSGNKEQRDILSHLRRLEKAKLLMPSKFYFCKGNSTLLHTEKLLKVWKALERGEK